MAKILIVDDDVSLVEIIAEVLANAEYEITTVTDPNVALQKIEEEIFDLVITDLNMPEVDGLAVTRAAKQRSENTEVVVVTGYASLESAVAAMKDGVYDYLLKPFNVADIIQTVERVLEKQQLTRANAELQQRVQAHLNQIETLHEISIFLNSSGSLEKVLSFAADTISSGIGIDMFSVMLKNPETGRFEMARAEGFSRETVSRFAVEPGSGPIGQSLNGNDVVFVENYHEDTNFQQMVDADDRERIQSFGLIPLRVEEEVLGMLTVHQLHNSDVHDREKLQLLSLIATQLAPLIKLHQALEEKVVLGTDPLFLVKRSMRLTLDKAKAYRGGLVFLLLKLYLKPQADRRPRILDVHDTALAALQASVSQIDTVVVMGLDTFIVILQSRSQVDAEVFVEEIKERMEKELREKGEAGFVVDYGTAVFPMDGTTAEELIGHAQQNLWRAAKGID